MSKIRKDVEALLTIGVQKVSRNIMQDARSGKPEDWRLLGRCAGRLRKRLRDMFDKIQDAEELRQAAVIHLQESFLETQVKAAYLFERAHSAKQIKTKMMD